jgi:Leucine-rich repeat (LRR) protein
VKDASAPIFDELQRAWLYFDGVEFAKDVLVPSGVDSLSLTQPSLLPCLPSVPGIRRLSLRFISGGQPPSLRPLDELPLLEYLTLVNINTETLTGVIRDWPSLRDLCLFAPQVRDISAIRSLPGLTSLVLYCAEISNLSILTELTGLRSIGLHGRKNLAVIGVLPQLPRLENLTIHDGGRVDLSPITQCQLRVTLHNTEATGMGADFLPSVERKSHPRLGSLADWALYRF